MTITAIRDDLEQIRQRWRSGTTREQQRDLVQLNDLLASCQLPGPTEPSAEAVDQVRGRIEILIDEIEIGLGIEPAPTTGYADF
ncbi:hypothetical protein ACVBEQ_23290 [Nakamurella sp. GG22]